MEEFFDASLIVQVFGSLSKTFFGGDSLNGKNTTGGAINPDALIINNVATNDESLKKKNYLIEQDTHTQGNFIFTGDVTSSGK